MKDGKQLETIMAPRKMGISPISSVQEKAILSAISKRPDLQKKLSQSIPIQSYNNIHSKISMWKTQGKNLTSLWGMLGKLFLLKGITDSMEAIVSDTANPIELILLGTELAPLTLWASLVVDNYSRDFEELYFRDFLRWKDIQSWEKNKYSSDILIFAICKQSRLL